MITAVMRYKKGTLIIELPHGIYDLYGKMRSIGISDPPQKIRLTDNEEDDIGIKLYSEDDFDRQLLLLFSEQDTLADVNLLMMTLYDRSAELQERVRQQITDGKCNSIDDIYAEIKRSIDETADTALSMDSM